MQDIDPALHRLNEQMFEFFNKLLEWRVTKDAVMRQVATEKYRQEVHRAAAAGFGHSLGWHLLGVWTEDGKGRIGCFSRALEALEKQLKAHPPQTIAQRRTNLNLEASCLYEIGRVHAAEGSHTVAKGFFERALTPARAAADLSEQDPAAPPHLDDEQEGKIASALLRLNDDE